MIFLNAIREYKKITAMLLTVVMIFSSLPCSALWDGFVGDERPPAVVELVDLNSVPAIMATKNGVPSENYTMNNKEYSIHWNNHEERSQILLKDIPNDWTQYDNFECWMYSEKITNGEFAFVFQSGTSYYIYKSKFDWIGWKKFDIEYITLTPTYNPTWKKIDRIDIYCTGWNMQPTDADVYISSIRLIRKDAPGYKIEQISEAKECLKGAACVYGGSTNVVTEGGNIVQMRNDLSAEYVNNKVYVPICYFEDYFGAVAKKTKEKYVISLNGKECNFNPEHYGFMINDTLYIPAEDTAEQLGLETVCDKQFFAASTEKDINKLERPVSTNINNEIVTYMAAVPLKSQEVSDEDFAKLKEKYLEGIVGNKDEIDLSNPVVAAKIEAINAKGEARWRTLDRTPGHQDIFKGMVAKESTYVTQVYSAMLDLCLAYGTYGCALYHNPKLKDDILYAFEWLYENRYGVKEQKGIGWRSPKETNWWDWYIGGPTSMIKALMIMSDEVSESVIKDWLYLYDYLVPTTYGNGANQLDTAYISIGAAIMNKDADRIKQIVKEITNSYVYMDHRDDINQSTIIKRIDGKPSIEGMYTDGSYLFHTVHAMNAAYGITALYGVGLIASLLKGTNLEIKNPQISNLSGWIYNGFMPLTYQGAMFRMVGGRTPGISTHGRHMIVSLLDCLDMLDDEDKQNVKEFIKTQVSEDKDYDYYSNLGISGTLILNSIMNDEDIKVKDEYDICHMYYIIDKAVVQKDKFALGVSMHSTRIADYESINETNATGWYLCDGMTEYYTKGQLHQTSDEYWKNIDPYRLPGTTVDRQERKAINIAQPYEWLSSKDFVGGVQLGDKYGTAAMWMESYNREKDFGEKDYGLYGHPAPAHDQDLEAKKAYFMFDDEVVCLGSDIHSSKNSEVLTILDNKVSAETVDVFDGERVEPYKIISVSASATPQAENHALNTIDEDYVTRWAAENGASIVWDIGEVKELGFIGLSFISGNKRKQIFDLEVSTDRNNWIKVFSGESSGTTEEKEAFDLKDTPGRFVRFTNYGNTGGSAWVSLSTAAIYPKTSKGEMLLPSRKTLGSDKLYVNGTEKEIDDNEQKIENAKWANLENVGGFYLPNGGEMYAMRTIGVNSYTQLWLSHGINPENETYEYVLLPGMTNEETTSYAQNPKIEILTNTPSLQAVRHKELGITGVVFWEPGSFEGITVDKPMIVMLQDKDNELIMSVSDPTQKLETAHISIDKSAKLVSCDHKFIVNTENNIDINIDFAESLGRSMEARFNY